MTQEELETDPTLRAALIRLRKTFTYLDKIEELNQTAPDPRFDSLIEGCWREIHRAWWVAVHIPTGGC